MCPMHAWMYQILIEPQSCVTCNTVYSCHVRWRSSSSYVKEEHMLQPLKQGYTNLWVYAMLVCLTAYDIETQKAQPAIPIWGACMCVRACKYTCDFMSILRITACFALRYLCIVFIQANTGADYVVQATMKLKKEEKDRLSAWLADLDKENDVLRCVHVYACVCTLICIHIYSYACVACA